MSCLGPLGKTSDNALPILSASAGTEHYGGGDYLPSRQRDQWFFVNCLKSPKFVVMDVNKRASKDPAEEFDGGRFCMTILKKTQRVHRSMLILVTLAFRIIQ